MDIPTESTIIAIRNKKTNKLFILIDENATHDRIRVINLTGHAVLMPKVAFASEVETIDAKEFGQNFTTEQLEGLQRLRDRIRQQADREREEKELLAAKAVRGTRSSTAKRSTRKAAPLRTPGGNRPGAIMDRWESTSLIFYRHKIQPLRANDRFCINVQGHGSFIMTKDDFERTFNDVLMSPKYQKEGMFSYTSPPERAFQFLKKEAVES